MIAGEEEGTFDINPMKVTWNDEYHLMFIDQPVGVGWSQQGNETNVTDTYEAADHFYTFLSKFYQLEVFAPFKDYPLYIFGESYGGSYIPVFSRKILEHNKATTPPAVTIPLAGIQHYQYQYHHVFSPLIRFTGIGIGDGWTDPIH